MIIIIFAYCFKYTIELPDAPGVDNEMPAKMRKIARWRVVIAGTASVLEHTSLYL